jgi:hypothetical protein
MSLVTGRGKVIPVLDAAEDFFKHWNAGYRDFKPERVAQLVAELVNLVRELQYQNQGLELLGPGFDRKQLDELLKGM